MEDIAKHRWGQGDTIEWFAPSRAGSPDARRALGRLERMAISPSTVLRMLGLIRDIDVRAALPAIHVPTLVIHRRETGSTRPSTVATSPSTSRAPATSNNRVTTFCDSQRLRSSMPCSPRSRTSFPPRPSPPQTTRALTTIMLANGVSQPPGLAAIQSHGGVVRARTADRVLATFNAPGRAIRCALALRDRARPGPGPLAIHTEKLTSLATRSAATLSPSPSRRPATPKTAKILVSRTVKDLVVGSEITFTDRASHLLAATGERWALCSVRTQ